MAKRKSLSKKIRFEVFKRDSFTCQYCGAKAPDTILEVDHIHPVKEGGTNDLMNLVTSCIECNRGKGAAKISDTSIVEKQRRQIEELNIRRQQLEMMLEWRDGIRSIKEEKYKRVISYWLEETGINLTEAGNKTLKSHVDNYGVMETLEAIDIAIEKYGTDEEEKTFNKIGGILYLKNKPKHIQQIAYIKGICRNRFHHFNERRASIALNEFHDDGYDLDRLQELLLTGELRNWSQFINYIEGN